ncbi:ATP-binding cassette domain-containing protein [Escherichia coli]
MVILDEPTSSLASAEVELVISAVKNMLLALGRGGDQLPATGWKKFAALPPAPLLCATGRWLAMMLENTSTHHIVSRRQGAITLILRRLHLRKLWIRPCWKSVRYAISPSWRISVLRYVVAKCWHCWSAGAGRSELLKAIVGLETYEQGEIVINGEKIMRPDHGDMLKRGIGYTPETAKKRGSFPGWALTKIQC